MRSLQECAEKHVCSERQPRQEVFVGEEERLWKATFTNYVPVPGRLPARRLATGSPRINPPVILRQWASKQDLLVGAGWEPQVVQHWGVQPAARDHMRPRVAVNVARPKIVTLKHYEIFCNHVPQCI